MENTWLAFFWFLRFICDFITTFPPLCLLLCVFFTCEIRPFPAPSFVLFTAWCTPWAISFLLFSGILLDVHKTRAKSISFQPKKSGTYSSRSKEKHFNVFGANLLQVGNKPILSLILGTMHSFWAIFWTCPYFYDSFLLCSSLWAISFMRPYKKRTVSVASL